MSSLPRPLVVVGPSGVGKGTLIGMLRDEFSNEFGFSVSHTTRGPRECETDGVEYHFVDQTAFQDMIDAGDFIEHAHVHKNSYGTSVLAVQTVHEKGQICILEIDVQGAEQIRKHPDFEAFTVFIMPPSVEELERRLRGRKTDSEDAIQKRLRNAKTEIEFCQTRLDVFDFVFVNDDLDQAYRVFRKKICEIYGLTPRPRFSTNLLGIACLGLTVLLLVLSFLWHFVL